MSMKDLTLEEQKAELINDLIATSTVMEELWNYPPDNPKKKDVVKEYEKSLKIVSKISNSKNPFPLIPLIRLNFLIF